MTGLDICLTSEDLHLIFKKYGEIKSCKVSIDPQTQKSRCYGYIWFINEKACSATLADAANLPYSVELFKPMCIRECEPRSKNQCTMLISNYPEDYDERALKILIGEDTI